MKNLWSDIKNGVKRQVDLNKTIRASHLIMHRMYGGRNETMTYSLRENFYLMLGKMFPSLGSSP